MLAQIVITAVPAWIISIASLVASIWAVRSSRTREDSKALISRVEALEEGFARLDERLKGTNDLLRMIHNDLRK